MVAWERKAGMPGAGDESSEPATTAAVEVERARLAALVLSSPDAIVCYDADTACIVSWNPAATRLFGYTEAEALGADFRLLMHESCPEGPDGIYHRVIAGEAISLETVRRRKDGSLVDVSLTAAPVRTTSGKLIGASGIFRDISARKRADAALAESEARLRAILEQMPIGVIVVSAPTGELLLHNTEGSAILGHPPIPVDAVSGYVAYGGVHADGRRFAPEDYPIARALLRAESVHCEPMRYLRPDGTVTDLEVSAAPILDRDGNVVLAVSTFEDVSERKKAERQRELLIHELSHRVKNTLGIVQSIAGQSLRDAPDLSTGRASFALRLAALSRAHGVLTRESWESASLREVIEAAVLPHGEGGRVVLDGPEIRIGPRAAISLSMALNELATNASKYGALTRDEGRVRLSWGLPEGGVASRLEIRWRECGGPTVTTPTRRGFGTRLITAGLAHDLQAEVRLDYAADGLACDITMPLDVVQRTARPAG